MPVSTVDEFHSSLFGLSVLVSEVVFAGTAEQSAVYVSVSDLSQRCYFIPHQAGLHEFHSSLN